MPQSTAPPLFFGMIRSVIEILTKKVRIPAGFVIPAVVIFPYGRKRRRDRIPCRSYYRSL
ncbi:MAG TPA: hypothetical protein VMW77_06035 [Methanoregula sp.]|nr:hypothetical protein [Methanoregula sp.]